jgi:hypothetical protein
MTRRIPALALVLASLLAAPGARAGENPCARDEDRFCSGKAPVDFLTCLQAHRADLDPGCRDYLENALVRIQVLIQDCEPDAFDLCKNAGRGEPTTMCLASNQGKLTPRCQEHFGRFARIEKTSAAACAADAGHFCPGVKPGKGEAYLCLLFRGKDVSAACRKAMVP